MADETPRKQFDQWKKLPDTALEPDVLRQETIISHHESLIAEIETSEGSLSTTLRAVYDGDEFDAFLDRLDARIKSHDKEIERMCNYHYQGFIDSIRELLQVSSDAGKLKDEIQDTNSGLQKSCAPLISKGGELTKCRRIQRNIASSIESLTLCLPVLEMYGKLQEQMRSKRYYPALKTLEQLEHTYLPRVMNHWFSQTMSEAIPTLRERIKDASMSDLKDFLENIRKHSANIGEVAMKHAAEQHNIDPKLAKKKPRKRRAPAPPNPFTGEIEIEEELPSMADSFEEEEELSAQDLVDFSPVYRCLHIYSVLGARETFETYYRKQRRKQARLSLEPSPIMHETMDGYKKYFHDIIGFFVVEDHILNTTSGLVNRAYMDELWEMAVSKIVSVLRTNCTLCSNADQMLEIKNLIMLFCHTLKGYGFSVGHLLEFLLELRDRYSEILMTKWVSVFDEIFADDNYTPILAEGEREYQAIVSNFPCADDKQERLSFPKRFPFSEFVPKVYNQVKEYINSCLVFSSDLHLRILFSKLFLLYQEWEGLPVKNDISAINILAESHTEIDDMIRRSTNLLLTQTLCACLSKLIKKPNLGLLQLIQISINMNYLEKSCTALEAYISGITGAEKGSVHVAKLHGTSMFKDAKSDAEEHIYKQLNLKIDEFLELASYDWLLPDQLGHSSEFLSDLVNFLQSTFMSFTNLPDKVARTACMSACKYISSNLMEFLLDNEIRQMTMGALQQLNLDLIECEKFAASEPVPGFNDGTLQMAFADLRQLLDLFLKWDWSIYLSDYGHLKNKYLRVQPQVAIQLLEKLNNADKKKNNLFASLKKNERDKKKLLDTVLKQLRNLTNGTNTQSTS